MAVIEADRPAVIGVPDVPPQLEDRARRALRWSFVNNVLSRIGTTAIGVILARILAPEDYGVFAVALVALNTLLSVNELGVSVAIVRWPHDVSRIAPTVQTLSLITSTLLWVGTFFLAPTIADALSAPEATWPLRLLTLAILIDAVTAVPAAVMTRDFMQRERTIVDAAGIAVSCVVTISLAVAGAGVWALMAGLLLGNAVNAAFILRFVPKRHAYGFDPSVVRELLAFGLPLSMASVLFIAMLNIDYVVVGARLGPRELGFYLLAFNLSTWPVNMFSVPARRISLPLFAQLHNGATGASAAFTPVCTMLTLVTLPACLMLAVFADPLVHVVYGDTWVPAGRVLPWLMALALCRVLGELIYDFLSALGSTVTNLVLQGIWLAALVVALPIAVRQDGIEGVAIGHAVVVGLVVVPAYLVILRRAGVSLRLLGSRLLRPSIAGLASLVAGIAVLELVGDRLAQLALGGIAMALVYAAGVYPMRGMLRSSALAEVA